MRLCHFAIILVLNLSFAAAALAESNAQAFNNLHQSFFHLLHPNKAEIELGLLYEPEHEEDGGPGEFDLFNYFGDIQFIVPQSEDNFISVDLGYSGKEYDFVSNVSLTQESSKTLHRGTIGLGLGAFLNEDLLVHAKGIAGVYSDFESSVDEDDFQLHAKGFLIYRFNPFTQILGGVYITEDFDDIPILPVAGLRLQSGGGKLHLSITAPVEAKVTYFFTPFTSLYAAGSIRGEEYRVEAGPADTEFDLYLQDKRIGVGGVHWINDTFKVSAEAGLNVNADFEFKTPGAGQFAGDTETAVYGLLKFGIAL